MKYLDDSELLTVLGGQANKVAPRHDSSLEHALTKLAGDIKDLARPQQNQQTMMMMMAAIIASKRG